MAPLCAHIDHRRRPYIAKDIIKIVHLVFVNDGGGQGGRYIRVSKMIGQARHHGDGLPRLTKHFGSVEKPPISLEEQRQRRIPVPIVHGMHNMACNIYNGIDIIYEKSPTGTILHKSTFSFNL